ncbi:hypothetical protein Btru_068871, partial [Bulinus truncatus]
MLSTLLTGSAITGYDCSATEMYTRQVKLVDPRAEIFACKIMFSADMGDAMEKRVSCCLCLLYVSMLANAMFYNTSSQKETSSNSFSFGPFSVSPEQIYIGVVSNLIVFPVNFLLIYLFRKSRPHHKRPSRIDLAIKEVVEQSKQASINDVKPEVSSIFSVSKTPTIPKDPYRPGTADSRPPTGMSYASTEKLAPKNKKKKFEFPWYFQIIAWIMLWIVTLGSVAMVIFYGISFQDDTCRKWISSLLISFFTSVFVTQPIKVFLIAIILSLIIKNPGNEEEDEENDEENPQVDTDSELLHSDVLASVKPKKIGYKPPDPQVIEKLRVQRMKEIQMWSVIREVIMYAFFLWILMLISYRQLGAGNFLYKDNMKRIFIDTLDTDINFLSLNNRDDFWKWANSGLLSGLRAGPYYNDYPPFKLRAYINDKVSRILGYATMRQLRVKPDQCKVPDPFQRVIHECNTMYNMLTQEERTYNIGWQPRGSNDLSNLTRTEYSYSSAEKLNGYPYWGILSLYSGGGYVVPLEGSKNELRDLFANLQSEQWIDRYTRAVFIEFTTYNPQINLFAINTLLAEFDQTGGLVPSYRFEPAMLLPYMTSAMLFQFVCEGVYMLFTVVFIVRELRSLIKSKLAYFLSFWNLVEIGIIAMSLAAIVIYFYRLIMTNNLTKTFKDTNGNGYVKFQYVGYWNEMFSYMIGFLIFFATLKFLKLLRFNKKISMLSATLQHSARGLLHFGLIFTIVFMAFSQLFYITYMCIELRYSSFMSTLISGVLMMMGNFDIYTMIMQVPILTQLEIFPSTAIKQLRRYRNGNIRSYVTLNVSAHGPKSLFRALYTPPSTSLPGVHKILYTALDNSEATYQGCYLESVRRRHFSVSPGDYSPELTTTLSCKKNCGTFNYKYAGITSGKFCYCANTLPVNSPVADSFCDVPCVGAANQMCGGARHVSVYDSTMRISGLSVSTDAVNKILPVATPVYIDISSSGGPDIVYAFDYDDGAGRTAPNVTDMLTKVYYLPGEYSIQVFANDLNQTLQTALAATTVRVDAPPGESNVTCEPVFATFEVRMCTYTIWWGTNLQVNVSVSSISYSFTIEDPPLSLAGPPFQTSNLLPGDATAAVYIMYASEFMVTGKILGYEMYVQTPGSQVVTLLILKPKCSTGTYCYSRNTCTVIACESMTSKVTTCPSAEQFCAQASKCYPSCTAPGSRYANKPGQFEVMSTTSVTVPGSGFTYVTESNFIQYSSCHCSTAPVTVVQLLSLQYSSCHCSTAPVTAVQKLSLQYDYCHCGISPVTAVHLLSLRHISCHCDTSPFTAAHLLLLQCISCHCGSTRPCLTVQIQSAVLGRTTGTSNTSDVPSPSTTHIVGLATLAYRAFKLPTSAMQPRRPARADSREPVVNLPFRFETPGSFVLEVVAGSQTLSSQVRSNTSTPISVQEGVNVTVISGPEYVKTGGVATFTVEPHSGSNVLYNWTFSDNTTILMTTNRSVSISFSQKGIYEVSVVTYNSVSVKSNSTYVYVQDEVTGLSVSSNATGKLDYLSLEIRFLTLVLFSFCNVSLVRGLNTTIVITVLTGSNYTFYFDYGDRSNVLHTAMREQPVTNVAYIYTFVAPGSYTINVTCANEVSSVWRTVSVQVQDQIVNFRLLTVGANINTPFSIEWATDEGTDVNFVLTLDGKTINHTRAVGYTNRWISDRQAGRTAVVLPLRLTASNAVSYFYIDANFTILTAIVNPSLTTTAVNATSHEPLKFTVNMDAGSDVNVTLDYGDGVSESYVAPLGSDWTAPYNFTHVYLNGGRFIVRASFKNAG